MFKPGDIVATKSNVFWHGEDIGDRLGRVVSSKGHIMVDLFDYDDNPVKCFSYELESSFLETPKDELEIDIDEMLEDLDP